MVAIIAHGNGVRDLQQQIAGQIMASIAGQGGCQALGGGGEGWQRTQIAARRGKRGIGRGPGSGPSGGKYACGWCLAVACCDASKADQAGGFAMQFKSDQCRDQAAVAIWLVAAGGFVEHGQRFGMASLQGQAFGIE